MMTTIQNVTSGKFAVAIVGYRGWRRDAAIGDGITAALHALVTRCDSIEAAEQLAAELNAALPPVMPGSQDVPVYQALPYRKADYLSRQQRDQNQTRDCDRRVVHQ